MISRCNKRIFNVTKNLISVMIYFRCFAMIDIVSINNFCTMGICYSLMPEANT